ncbi:MAG TPA: class I SAM-dependent methyltransferase [Thermoanaerobaculia bacterium]|nr:class I SAM-dependent methyltransferase [Thermoanaerobaculia bacterium]
MTPTYYGDDLTYVHDVGHGDLARAAAQTLVELLRRSGRARGRVVDLGCGSGILARGALDAGYEVTGVDISEAMIAAARERAPEADLRVGSYLDAEIPSCVAVTAIGECFSYLFDQRLAGAGLDRLLERIHRALEPRGLLLFDVAAPGRVRGKSPQRSWQEGADWAVLVEVDEDVATRRLTRAITTFRASGGTWRRDHEVHALRLYDRRELEPRVRGVGFTVRPLARYGALRFGPGHIGFCARKA